MVYCPFFHHYQKMKVVSTLYPAYAFYSQRLPTWRAALFTDGWTDNTKRIPAEKSPATPFPWYSNRKLT
jgi:hypothetical protein